MATRLYLDTARMGQMSPGAQRAQIDFICLAGEEAGFLYFDEFLRSGFQTWPQTLQSRYPALQSWGGIATLKEDLKQLAGATKESRLLIANRTSQLMRFAARLLFGPCRNVLITDLTWLAYQKILIRQARRSGNRLTLVKLRRGILRQRISAGDLIGHLAQAFTANRCDGLFLPYVDNLGICLPVPQLVAELRTRVELRFTVIDGAQAFCHVPFRCDWDFCDFLITGCHKWLRAYNPMGLGFYGSRGSRGYIEKSRERMLSRGRLDDPLVAFSEGIESGRLSAFSETVNLAPLFSCRGAVDDTQRSPFAIMETFTRRQENAQIVAGSIERAGWKMLRPPEPFHSGIVLIQPTDPDQRNTDRATLRRALRQRGVAATSYKAGRVRLSMPDQPWEPAQLDLLRNALSEHIKSSQSKLLQ